MTRSLRAWMLLLFVASTAAAQDPPPGRGQRPQLPRPGQRPLAAAPAHNPFQCGVATSGDHPGRRHRPLSGVGRLQYIVTRVSPASPGREAVDAAFSEYQSKLAEFHKANAAELEKWRAASRDARQRGDAQASQAAAAELAKIKPPPTFEAEFHEKARATITAAERERWDALLRHLESNPAGVFRPVDALETARSLPLSSEQQSALDKLEAELRQSINVRTAVLSTQMDLLRKLLIDVRAVLTAEQATNFDAERERIQAALDAASKAIAAAKPDDGQSNE